ncbi:MAG: hypothetical protein HY006_03760 [Candidatus Sungbacteria bacterium]|nr:hypothetical protein [Candidatus Sungbacteria bacterium]
MWRLFGKRTTEYAGLDISDRSIKLVVLRADREPPFILCKDQRSLPPGIVEQGAIRAPKQLAAIVQELFAVRILRNLSLAVTVG